MNRLRWPAADNVVLKSVTEIYLTLHPKATDFVSFFRFFTTEKSQIGSNFGSGITLEYFLPRIDSECTNIAQRAILNFALVHTLEILPKVLRYPRRRFTTIKCIIDEDFPKQFSTRTTRQRRKNRVKGLSDKSKLRLVFKSMLR